MDWFPEDFLDRLTIHFVEHDDKTPKIDLNLSTRFEKKKDAVVLGDAFLTGSENVMIEDVLDGEDVEVGRAEYGHYQSTDLRLEFPQVEFTIAFNEQ